MSRRSIWIGFDPREVIAYAVCRASIREYAPTIPVFPVHLGSLMQRGLYNRPTEVRDGKLWDEISEAPMSTEFAISRFLVPHLTRRLYAGDPGWALFIDCDFLARAPLDELFAAADPTKAVMVVKHHHEPDESVKMDGQKQLLYARKNWSSCMLWNCGHPSNRKLTIDLVNELPGRDLHRFCWLEDDEIGELNPAWNYLVGYSDPTIEPKMIHWTSGGPWFPGYENVEYAAEWNQAAYDWIGVRS